MAKEKEYHVTTKFEECIKNFLDSVASDSPEFAKKYSDPEKSVEECCNYIVSEVKRQKKKAYTDGEIYCMARHYYDEPKKSLVIDAKQSECEVVTPTDVELPDEIDDEIVEETKPIEKPKVEPKPKVKKQKSNENQLTIFDLDPDLLDALDWSNN
jgi:hypothetical protein